jgi:polysaccharide deacetylase family protein (PEP-CTERM system associated)
VESAYNAGKRAHIFTVDVEEYYHAENVHSFLKKSKFHSLNSRLEIGMRKIMDMLDFYQSTATFFVLGCLAKTHKSLIREISNAGHEVANHGYLHKPLRYHSRVSFEDSLKQSISLLSDIIRKPIIGYREPGFLLDGETGWFFDVLKKHGMVYDSSIALSCFRRGCCRFFHSEDYFKTIRGIREFPVSRLIIGPLSLPLGGGYFRAYPYWITQKGFYMHSKMDKNPFVFYIHPWELDPGQPRLALGMVKSIRHYMNLVSTEQKLQRLFKTTRFTSIENFINNEKHISTSL